jgi:hypothetical protein
MTTPRIIIISSSRSSIIIIIIIVVVVLIIPLQHKSCIRFINVSEDKWCTLCHDGGFQNEERWLTHVTTLPHVAIIVWRWTCINTMLSPLDKMTTV